MAESPMDRVLRLVAEGRLSAEEAGPILDALDASGSREPAGTDSRDVPPGAGPARAGGTPRFARIEVLERGRTAVDLRIPLSLGRRAIGAIPGLSFAQVAELEEAVQRGHQGPIVDISDEDGSAVRIALE